MSHLRVKDDDDIQRQVKSLYCAVNKVRGSRNSLYQSYGSCTYPALSNAFHTHVDSFGIFDCYATISVCYKLHITSMTFGAQCG